MKKLINRFKSRTHWVVKLLQLVLVAISSTALYYGGLPEEWKTVIPSQYIQILSVTGYALTFILQFTSQKKA